MTRSRLVLLLVAALLLAATATAARTVPAGRPLDRSVARAMTPQQRAYFAAEDGRMAKGMREVEQKRAAALAQGIPASAWSKPFTRQPRPGGVTSAISRGKVAADGKLPYMASLWNSDFSDDNGDHFCGGTLIRKNVILTAAHCLIDGDGYRWPDKVKVGGIHLRWDDTLAFFHYRETRFPVRLIVHPGYKNEGYADDVALIQLDRPVNTTAFPPIALAPATFKLRQGQTLMTSGWGMSETAPGGSEALLYTYLPFVDRKECTRRQGGYPTGHICAGGSGGADSCSGDSGGPLTIDANADVQVGVVSYGPTGCGADPKVTGYYTSVMFYRKWIDAVLRKYRL